MREYYLNNSGSRWVVYDNDGKKEKRTFLTRSGKEITRRVQWYESFGNHALLVINYKGKRFKVFADEVLED